MPRKSNVSEEFYNEEDGIEKEQTVMMFKRELIKFLQHTSVKGIPRYFKVEHLNLKLLWACAILMFFIIGIYQSFELLSEYTSFPKGTFIQEHAFSFKEDFSFPNVHLCSVFPTGRLTDIKYNESLAYYGKKVMQLTECGNCSATEQEQLREMKENFMSANGYIQYIGLDNAVKLMKNYSDFLIECLVFAGESISGKKCDIVGQIEVVPSVQFLSCLRVKIPQSLPVLKVSMTFYIDTFDNNSKFYNSENLFASISGGVVYSVYHPAIKNIMFKDQSTAPPGLRTSVKIQKEIHTRLSQPYGKCIKGMGNYNQLFCVNDCVSKLVVKHCNCYTQTDIRPKNESINSCLSVETNQINLLENYKCELFTKAGMIMNDGCSECKHSCSEIRYNTKVSYTKWPLPHQYSSFYRKLIRSKPFASRFATEGENLTDTIDFSSKKDLFNENFVKIDFSLNTQAYLEFLEVPKYTLFSFLGTLGGALNLWTGITVVVVVEIIEVVVNIVNSTISSKVTGIAKK